MGVVIVPNRGSCLLYKLTVALDVSFFQNILDNATMDPTRVEPLAALGWISVITDKMGVQPEYLPGLNHKY